MMLRVHNLSLFTSTKSVVGEISFELQKGQSLAIIGPSGSGKTTLLRGILGIADDLFVTGHVTLSFATEVNMPPHQRRFGYIPQELSLWPHLTVEKTLELAHRFSNPQRDHVSTNTAVNRLLNDCGLNHLRKSLPRALSGGEKQRLALARALVTRPHVLILDEPFCGLDVVAKSELITLITTLKKDEGFSIIFVSHDLAETLALGDHLMIMDRGRSLWLGPKHELSSARFSSHWNPLGSPLVCLHHFNNAI